MRYWSPVETRAIKEQGMEGMPFDAFSITTATMHWIADSHAMLTALEIGKHRLGTVSLISGYTDIQVYDM